MANNGVDVLPRQVSSGVVAAPTGYLELFADEGTSKMSSVDEVGVVTKYGTGTIPLENTYFVGKHGNDANSGTSLGDAVLTFGQAITLAIAQVPSSSNGFFIQCRDAGVYTESFNIPAYVTVGASGAVIRGNITCEGFGSLNCLALQAISGVAFTKDNDDDTGTLIAQLVVAAGSTVDCAVCSQGTLIVHIMTLQTINGVGVLASGASAHIAGDIAQLAVVGTGTAVKTMGASSETSLVITELVGAAGTGLDVDGGEAHLVIGEFNVGTGGDVASGAELTMFAADLYGATFTGAGEIKVTEAGVTADHGAASHTGSIGTHSQLTSIGVDDHHDEDHNTRHQSGGADAIKLDNLATPDDNTDLDASASAHGLLPKLSDDGAEFLDGEGNWATPEAVFGSRFQDAESSSESENSTTSWSQKLNLAMPSDTPAGRYRIGIFYNWRFESLSHDFEARARVDDTDTVFVHTQEPKDTGTDQEFVASGFAYVDLTAASHTIDIDYRSSSGGDSAFIKNARIEVWRVS